MKNSMTYQNNTGISKLAIRNNKIKIVVTAKLRKGLKLNFFLENSIYCVEGGGVSEGSFSNKKINTLICLNC